MIRRLLTGAFVLAVAAPALAVPSAAPVLLPDPGVRPDWATGGISPTQHQMFGATPLFASAFARDDVPASPFARDGVAAPGYATVKKTTTGAHTNLSRYPYQGTLPPSGYTINPVSGYEVYRAAANDSNELRSAQ